MAATDPLGARPFPEPPTPPGLPRPEQVLAGAVRFLIEGGEEEAARLLLTCSLILSPTQEAWYDGDTVQLPVRALLAGPRAAYDALSDPHHPTGEAARRALEAVLPPALCLEDVIVRAQVDPAPPGWRDDLLEVLRGCGVHNQVSDARPLATWNNLRFRSQSEVAIAQALDRAGALFLPNCKARLGDARGRRNREADFLVCHQGKWGILEVDGEPFHPPSRASQDHERDRLFRAHGILVVEHFDANECRGDPGGVVRRFLGILSQA
jgi:hypothetical protein